MHGRHGYRGGFAMPAAGALAGLAAMLAPLPVSAQSWIDGARYGHYGVDYSRLAHAEPRPPVKTEREIIDSRSYALRHGFDVHEIEQHGFVGDDKNGIFDYAPVATITVAPQPGSHRALATPALRLQPNNALYGFESRRPGDSAFRGPLAPADSALHGLSPRSLAIDRR